MDLSYQEPAERAAAASPRGAGSPAACSVSWQKSRCVSYVFSCSLLELTDMHRTMPVQKNSWLSLLINSLTQSYSNRSQME